MVYLVSDWEILRDYAGDKQGFYQLIGNDDSLEIRIYAGKVGFKKEFKTKKDPLLNDILTFCRDHKCIRVSENIRDDSFFK